MLSRIPVSTTYISGTIIATWVGTMFFPTRSQASASTTSQPVVRVALTVRDQTTRLLAPHNLLAACPTSCSLRLDLRCSPAFAAKGTLSIVLGPVTLKTVARVIL